MYSDDLRIFRESLARVVQRAGFFDRFYARFMACSDEIAVLFRHRNMEQLKQKLRDALEVTADTAEGLPGTNLYMELLGRIHSRLQVTRRHFGLWRDALLDTVADDDPEYSFRVRLAWQRVIDSVIEQMFSRCPEEHGQDIHKKVS